MSIIPDILVQKCEESDLIKPIELSKKEEGFNYGRFLTHKGQNTEFFYAIEDHRFILYETSNPDEPYYVWVFDYGTIIVDAIYFPINETTKGVAVAVWDPSYDSKPNYVALISLKNKQIVKKLQLGSEIQCLYSIYDGAVMPQAKLKLQKAFHENWPHILLVGCRNGLACLTHFGVVSDELDENSKVPTKPKKCINLSKLFTGNGEGFVFKADDGQVKTMRQKDAVVTGLHYIEKAHTVVVGYNFGGLVFVSLVNQKVQCYYLKDGAIEHFSVQEPEDDPRPILWFWCSIRDNSNKQYCVVLMNVMFPQDESSSKNPSDWTYEYPYFSPILKWYPENCSKFLGMRTIFLNRGQISDDKPVELNESGQMNTSSTSIISSAHDTSLMLMTWISMKKGNTKVKLHGALFDLNMFYYKRLIPRMVPDSTIAKQYPFLARFVSRDEISIDPKDTLDVIIRPQSIHRFFVPTMLTDTFDQLYMPSTFTYDAKVLTKKTLLDIRVRSLQDQVLLHVGQNLVNYFLNPSEPSQWLYALALTNRIPNGSFQEERVCVLKALLHNAYHHSIGRLLTEDNENLTDEDRKFVVKWLWKEIEHAKNKLDDFTMPLFSGVSGLSTAAKMFVRNMEPLFMRVEAILTYLLENCTPESEADQDWLNLVQVQLAAIQGLVFYAKMLNFSRFYHLLPETDLTREINMKIRENFQERRQKSRQHGHPQLEIVKFIQEMMSANHEDPIWQAKSAESWYPPSYKTLLSTLLLVNISSYAKTALLGYYFQDFDQTKLWQEANGDSMYSKFLSVAVNPENFIEFKHKIEDLWSNDDKAAKNQLKKVDLPTKLILEKPKKMPTSPEDMDNCPLITKEDVRKALEVFLNFEHSSHEWNKFVIARKRYDLIMEVPPGSMDEREPEDIVQCRIEVDRIKKQYPFLFMEVGSLPQEIIEKFKDIQSRHVRQEDHVTTRKKPISLQVQKHDAVAASLTQPGFSTPKRNLLQDLDDEDFELRHATPAKRSRFTMPATPKSVLRPQTSEAVQSPIVNQACPSVRSKYLERIKKVMQSPAVKSKDTSVLRDGPSTQFSSPVFIKHRTPMQAPESILKSTTKKPPKRDLDGTPLRLRFDLPSTSKPQVTVPQPLIFEEHTPRSSANDSIDVVPTDESSMSFSSSVVTSPEGDHIRPVLKHREVRVEEQEHEEEPEEETVEEDSTVESEEVTEESEDVPETPEKDDLEEDEEQEEMDEEPGVVEKVVNTAAENEQESADDSTYTINKPHSTSCEEQDPDDPEEWPEDEEAPEELSPEVSEERSGHTPENVLSPRESPIPEEPTPRQVQLQQVVEIPQEVIEEMSDEVDVPPVVPESPVSRATETSKTTSSVEDEQVVPESDHESDMDEVRDIEDPVEPREPISVPIQVTQQAPEHRTSVAQPVEVIAEAPQAPQVQTIRIERTQILEVTKNPAENGVMERSFEEQDPMDVEEATSSKTGASPKKRSVSPKKTTVTKTPEPPETPKSSRRSAGRPRKVSEQVEQPKESAETPKKKTPRPKKTEDAQKESEKEAEAESRPGSRYSFRSRGNSTDAAINMSETTKEWLQANKRKVAPSRKRKTSATFERGSPTKSIVSAPSPERPPLSPVRKMAKERSASEEPKPASSKIPRAKDRRSRNRSIMGTSILQQLSPLHETNESGNMSKQQTPPVSQKPPSTERKSRGRPRKTTMLFEKEFNVSDVPLTSTPAGGAKEKSPIETPKRPPTPEEQGSSRSLRARSNSRTKKAQENLATAIKSPNFDLRLSETPPLTPKNSKSRTSKAKTAEKREASPETTPKRATASKERPSSRANRSSTRTKKPSETVETEINLNEETPQKSNSRPAQTASRASTRSASRASNKEPEVKEPASKTRKRNPSASSTASNQTPYSLRNKK